MPEQPSSPAIPVFELNGVSHRFDAFTALENVSWRVDRGQHWAVLGPNGAGKTTLLRIVAGYLWPNAGGHVIRDGRRLTDLRELRKRIGWVTASLVAAIPPREPVLKTVLSGKFAQIGLVEYHGMRMEPADHQRARDYLALVGCDELVDQAFGTLSQGQQQKVLIARARMARPLLIILDDPCTGLDPGAREKLLASLEDLTARPAAPSLVLVTHHVEEIMPAFANTLVLQAGRVKACGPTAAVVTSELVGELYEVPMQVRHHNGRCWPEFAE